MMLSPRDHDAGGKFAKAPPDGYLTPVRTRIFDALCEHPYGLSCAELCDRVYGEQEDGGPEMANHCLYVTVVAMNKKWRKAGSCLRVRSTHRRYQIWIVAPCET